MSPDRDRSERSRLPDRVAAAIDSQHLARQTQGDAALEREVLGLFADQCGALAADIAAPGDPGRRGEAAHKLKGAALAVGAWRLADLAAALERDPVECGAEVVRELLATLTDARVAAQARAAQTRSA